ncbi:MAG: NUDIX hydrolase [Candidatus Daviesbacteria bacterium GW2011_GWF2_38_6]|uniref:NUDIX hydrolase n=1 Tax=Candidatus Daviesbacteria bacterium GW2011_GWF2_38_6 TaxID=1618432 RepID=A0A0G0KGK2_9BACT|nr:MAG: NUDIX hydrolase [Candidatus Daviesbacteria bacterium GW2011_GWF2_38_6]
MGIFQQLMNKKTSPKIGISVLVMKQGKVLLGKRRNTHGAGEYASPGGHLEFNESIEDAARRECREEAGIEIKNIKFLRFSNMRKYGKHYGDIGLTAEWKSGEVKVCEPQKMEKWDWYKLNNLPKPLFAALDDSFEALKTGNNFFDE